MTNFTKLAKLIKADNLLPGAVLKTTSKRDGSFGHEISLSTLKKYASRGWLVKHSNDLFTITRSGYNDN